MFCFCYGSYGDLPSGYVKIAIEAMTIEIVDVPIKHGDVP